MPPAGAGLIALAPLRDLANTRQRHPPRRVRQDLHDVHPAGWNLGAVATGLADAHRDAIAVDRTVKRRQRVTALAISVGVAIVFIQREPRATTRVDEQRDLVQLP